MNNLRFCLAMARAYLTVMVFIWFAMCSPLAKAVSCSTVFSSGAQSHSASGYLEMDWQSRISGGGTALKVPSIIDGSGWASCQTAACTATGTYNSVINYSVPASTGADGAISVNYRGNVNRAAGHYANVNVGQEGNLRFSTNNGQYYTNGFTTNYQSSLNLAPGDYYINGNLIIGQDNIISISGNGPARIFVNGSVSFAFKSSSSNTNPANLLIYAKNSVTLDNEVDLKAFIYSQTGGITMEFRAKVTGGVSAAGRIFLDNEASVTYSNSASTADFGALCNDSAPAINSFTLDTGDSTASTCSPKNITITVRDGSNNKLTGYTGTISLATSTGRGSWAKTNIPANAHGVLVVGTDNGQASYTFTTADAGDIVLGLSNQRAQSLTVAVADSGAGISGASSTITFSENAFVIQPAASFGADVIAMRDHPFTATMMRRHPETGECGAAVNYNVPNLKMWLTRASDDPGGAAPNAVGTNTAALPNTQPSAVNIHLSFTNGVAPFSLRTTDVGKYAINLADTSNAFASSVILGGSDTVVVRPFGIDINVAGNPASTNSSGLKFRATGQPFTVTVRVVGWQAVDDNNNDGIPDYHNDDNPGNNANLANNISLVKFGREMPQEGITLSSQLVLPGGGSESGLSGGSFVNFSTGAASSPNVSFGEVGIIEIGAKITDNNYLGSPGSTKIMGKSGYVGRFYPHHFRLSNLAVQPTCNAVLPYSYLEEPFSLAATMTPYSAAGNDLQNYKDGFNKFNIDDTQTMLSAVDEADSVSLTSRIAITSDDSAYVWSNVGVLTATPQMKINRSTNPDGPFSQVKIGFTPVDADGVTLRAGDLNLDTNGDGVVDAVQIGSSTMGLRYGRLRLDDSYGPETANLPVIFRTEYWDGSEWKQNRDDSCTQISLTEIAYPAGPINVVANRSPPVGGGSTTGEYSNLTSTSVGFSEGDAGHFFTAPGAGNIGSVRVKVNLTSYPWLRFDWNNDGDFTDASLPDANFTFGNYRGHDRVLYWIEAAGY